MSRCFAISRLSLQLNVDAKISGGEMLTNFDDHLCTRPLDLDVMCCLGANSPLRFYPDRRPVKWLAQRLNLGPLLKECLN